MKTKNIIKKGLLLISVATFASCSSFLEEENWTSQSAEDYYKTAKGYESLVNGAYASLKSVYNNYSYHKLTQLGTDIGTQPNGTVTSDLNQYVVTYDKSNGTVYEQWSKLYVALKDVNAAIGRATNVTLKTEDPIEGIDPNQRDLRVAEVKFLRALYLFEIVKNWGQAPLVLEEAQSTATTSKLNSGAEFYTQILKDLQDVLSSSLPEKQGASDFGRASKAAARHLRALVYLTRGYQDYADVNDFKNAYDDAMYVIEKTGHSLLEDYAMVHRQSNEANDEVIFAVNYNNSTNNNNRNNNNQNNNQNNVNRQERPQQRSPFNTRKPFISADDILKATQEINSNDAFNYFGNSVDNRRNSYSSNDSDSSFDGTGGFRD